MTKETLTIQDGGVHLVLTWSGGDVTLVPKKNLTVIYRPGKQNKKIFMTWPSGTKPYAFDSEALAYGDVTSPSVSSDAALFLQIKSMMIEELHLTKT